MRRWSTLAAVLAVGVAADQGTKHLATAHLREQGIVNVVEGLFDLRYALNPGAFFSLGAELPSELRLLLFVLASLVATALIVRLYARASAEQRTLRVGLALLLSGATGNLVDRIVSGAVVDFLHLSWGELQWATFNVADVLITAGLVALVVDLLRRREPESASGGPGPVASASINPTVNEIDS
jgi:signal peptidase II